MSGHETVLSCQLSVLDQDEDGPKSKDKPGLALGLSKIPRIAQGTVLRGFASLRVTSSGGWKNQRTCPWLLVREGPEIHAGVSTPRAPGFPSFIEVAGIAEIEGAQEAKVAGGKCVGLTQSSHGHILRGPTADAGYFTEAFLKRLGVEDAIEGDVPVADGASQGANGLRSFLG